MNKFRIQHTGNFKTIIGFILLIIVVMILTVLARVVILPPKDVTGTSLSAKIHLTQEVKNMPIVKACSEPRYTMKLPDCGAGACPTRFEIFYKSRASKEEIIAALDNYVESLSEPYEYNLSYKTNFEAEISCASSSVDFYSLKY